MQNIGLLILRLFVGFTMMFSHGLPKFLGYSEYLSKFPDPIGLGVAASLCLAIFAEFVCSAFIAAGLFTRIAVIPPMITMAVAFFIIHGQDPFQKKELALAYLASYLAIFFTGPGDFSIQGFFKISSERFGWLLK